MAAARPVLPSGIPIVGPAFQPVKTTAWKEPALSLSKGCPTTRQLRRAGMTHREPSRQVDDFFHELQTQDTGRRLKKDFQLPADPLCNLPQRREPSPRPAQSPSPCLSRKGAGEGQAERARETKEWSNVEDGSQHFRRVLKP